MPQEEEKKPKKIFVASQVLGYIATVLSIVVWIPVIIENVNDPDTLCNYSIYLVILTLITNVFWTVYGGLIAAWPLFVSSVLVVVLVVTHLSLRLVHDCPSTPPPPPPSDVQA